MERQVVSLFGCLLALPWLLSEFVIVEGDTLLHNNIKKQIKGIVNC